MMTQESGNWLPSSSSSTGILPSGKRARNSAVRTAAGGGTMATGKFLFKNLHAHAGGVGRVIQVVQLHGRGLIGLAAGSIL